MRILLFVFILIPALELWLLIRVGGQIGALNTIFLVIFTAFLGAFMLRKQGLSTLLRVRQRLDEGLLPAAEILEGLLLAVAGALLLTPGFVTDFVGFCCLLPSLRRKMVSMIIIRGALFSVGLSSADDAAAHDRDGRTIEGDYRREKD